MLVAIRADASTDIGSGHVMRCLTLAHRLRKENDAQVVFVMRDLPGNLIEVASRQGFHVLTLPRADKDSSLSGYGLWLTVSKDRDAAETLSAIKSYLGKIQQHMLDRLVVDSYALDSNWETPMRSVSREIMVIDDLANRKHDCDILLDQNFYLDRDSRYKGLVPEHCRLLLGPEHALLREEFYEAKKHLRHRDGHIRNILVFYGGSDLTDETTKAIQALCQLHDMGYAFTADIITGLSNARRKEIQELCQEYDFLHYYCQVDNMAEFMNQADLMLGAGGSTTWERLYMELPALVTAIADNQVQGCHDCAQAGMIDYLGWAEDVSSQDIVGAVEKCLKSKN